MSDLMMNNLAGLLVVTSFLVVIARKAQTAAWLYALQSLVLVGLFVAIAHRYDAHELYSWSVTAFISKVILVPAILFIQLGKMRDAKAEQPLIRPVWIALIVAVISIACLYVIEPVQLPLVASLKPILGVSLAHFFIGLLCIISQRNILKQIFGYCLMENGSSLMLALVAHSAPHLVEIGITVDALFAVIVMVILARLIYAKLRTLDVKQLTVLKG
ncbi:MULTISPECIES: hydrogenase 4 membrane subunit [Vibrio]|uniref:Hydrogenase 4 membrane subunit n=2 Tax=Vibrio TaxID=662 RepID=A0A7X4LIP1_9VIBR|nr:MULTISPECIES: hydrogenase 4 membrane subunit [Vibrio]MBF9001430.1 hydrogenase 4 membrane subunit [Vibrio nitrifigilis]MZI92655.1 hydrogenase 4 membrane subunit [Vibrio eleionomae]